MCVHQRWPSAARSALCAAAPATPAKSRHAKAKVRFMRRILARCPAGCLLVRRAPPCRMSSTGPASRHDRLATKRKPAARNPPVPRRKAYRSGPLDKTTRTTRVMRRPVPLGHWMGQAIVSSRTLSSSASTSCGSPRSRASRDPTGRSNVRPTARTWICPPIVCREIRPSV